MKNVITLSVTMIALTGCFSPSMSKDKKEESANQSSQATQSKQSSKSPEASPAPSPVTEESDQANDDSAPDMDAPVIVQLPAESDSIVENGVNSESSESQDDETLIVATSSSAPVVSIADGNIFLIENNSGAITIYLNHEDGSVSSVSNLGSLDSRIQSVVDQQEQSPESVLLSSDDGAQGIDVKTGEVIGYATESDSSIELKVLSTKKGQKLDRKIKQKKGRCFVAQMKFELLEKLTLSKKLGHRFGCGQGKRPESNKKSK